jgi:hypothetical protein
MSLVGDAEASVIVRVWFEDYPAHPIRFVVSTVGLAAGDGGRPELRRATTSIDEACAAVRDALEALTAARTEPVGNHHGGPGES